MSIVILLFLFIMIVMSMWANFVAKTSLLKRCVPRIPIVLFVVCSFVPALWPISVLILAYAAFKYKHGECPYESGHHDYATPSVNYIPTSTTSVSRPPNQARRVNGMPLAFDFVSSVGGGI